MWFPQFKESTKAVSLEMNIQYKGARWFKSDLHLHTPASQCFLDKSVTPEQWVAACLEAGLDCVAVTDHNTGAWIDCIKAAADGSGLFVFPGVEITCDTSKIHLLVLFDQATTTQNVEDFLITCGISRDSFASEEAHSSMTVIEIAQKANDAGALVIPAHIDEFNGLAYVASVSSLNDFLKLPFIHAVQFVHNEFLDKSLTIKNNQELLSVINSYYGNRTTAIGEDNIKSAYQGLQTAITLKKRLLTFSDNPDSTNASKHGLAGIGSRYTWVKMSDKPTLEGLRQAFMMPERTVHCFDSGKAPYQLPRLWLRKISVQNTTITKNGESFEVEFNPQLTTIIGGRGSGKSSVLRFLRGVFNRVVDLEGLAEVKEDYSQFFKKVDSEGQGVLKDDTKIEVLFVRDNLDYKVSYKQGKDLVIEKLDPTAGVYQPVTDEGFIDFLQFEEYSQKQIFSIAQRPNSLRNRIDSAIDGYDDLLSSYKQARQGYRQLKENQRSLLQAIQNKGKVTTEINDLKSKIELLKQSGISADITRQQSFDKQRAHIKDYLQEAQGLIERLKEFYPEFENYQGFDSLPISEEYRDSIAAIIQQITNAITTTGTLIKEKSAEVENVFGETVTQIKQTQFYTDAEACRQQFEAKKAELEQKGVTDMSDFEKYNRLIGQKEDELKVITTKETELNTILIKIGEQQRKAAEIRQTLSQKRNEFVSGCINSTKIKVVIRPYFDKDDFKNKLRKIVQKLSGYDRGIDTVTDEVYADNNVLSNLASFKERMHQLHTNNLANNYYDGRFTSLIQDLTESQMDEIDLLYPQDQIEMRYKGRDGNFKPLSVASAGQKTTAILTFILSFGDVPLILDQPEDDLDNRLVYDLIVDKMRQIKEKRQVIVVTHNANIPVNGDAEYVVSLSSETHNLKIQAEGTIEDEKVKNEICEVMEGGVEAFQTRAKRYAALNGR